MAGKTYDKDLLAMIQNYWPDFSITKENLIKPTSDFVIRFYTNFLAELNDRFYDLVNEELLSVELPESQDFPKEVYLYKRLSEIYRKLKYTGPFSLNDLYDPQPKRTSPLLRFSIHFLTYINNNLDVVDNITSSVVKKSETNEEKKLLKQQYLHETAETSETLAHALRASETLKVKLDGIKKGRYEQMWKDREANDLVQFEKTREMKKFQIEKDSLQLELNHLDAKEEKLKKLIVADEDFEYLKKTVMCLQQELEEISSEIHHLEVDVDKDMEMEKRLQEYAKQLESLSYEDLAVFTLHDIREEAKVKENIRDKLEKECHSLEDIKTSKLTSIKKNDKKDKLQRQHSKLTKKLAAESESDKKLYESTVAQYRANFEEFQRLKTAIVNVQEKMAQISIQANEIRARVESVIGNMVAAAENSTGNLVNMLSNLKNQI